MAAPVRTTYKPWIDESDCRLDDFRAQVLRDADLADYPLATDLRSNVLVYSAATVGAADRRTLQSELIRALADGPGVVIFEDAFSPGVVDRASEAFFAMHLNGRCEPFGNDLLGSSLQVREGIEHIAGLRECLGP